jgi:hypothetical protein
VAYDRTSGDDSRDEEFVPDLATTVETYVQGEDRFRLQLGASITRSKLAVGIERRLGQRELVRVDSIADRSVQIVLE